MAVLHITEFQAIRKDIRAKELHVAAQPGVDSSVTYTTSTQSVAFAVKTKFVRVIADAKAHLKFGRNPTAVAGDPYIAADNPEYFGVEAGHKVAAYDGSS